MSQSLVIAAVEHVGVHAAHPQNYSVGLLLDDGSRVHVEIGRDALVELTGRLATTERRKSQGDYDDLLGRRD